MKDREIIEGVCCVYCFKFETKDCPIKTADPWSRWNYCSSFEKSGNGKTIPEILKANK